MGRRGLGGNPVGFSDACVMKICLQLTIVLWPQSMLKQGLCIITQGEGSCSKRCCVLNFQNRQRRHCQPFTQGKGGRERGICPGLILTEWALQVKFPEFLNLCVMTTRLAFLSNTGFCSSWNFRYRVVDQNHSFILFCLINMLGILSLDAGLSFNSANPQRASGGFSCWGCQEQ